MIRRLIILLLIVGCAPTKPTTANFYLGMNKEEFDIKNSNIIPDQFPHKLAHTQTVVDKTIPDNTYIFYFENDTLIQVFRGGWLYPFWFKEIDYYNYATPPK